MAIIRKKSTRIRYELVPIKSIGFFTDDGREFDTYEDAYVHERKLMFSETLEKWPQVIIDENTWYLIPSIELRETFIFYIEMRRGQSVDWEVMLEQSNYPYLVKIMYLGGDSRIEYSTRTWSYKDAKKAFSLLSESPKNL